MTMVIDAVSSSSTPEDCFPLTITFNSNTLDVSITSETFLLEQQVAPLGHAEVKTPTMTETPPCSFFSSEKFRRIHQG